MGTVLACLGCYCCLLGVRPKYLELIALLANIIEIGFLIWGAAGIPWSDLNSGRKACYYIAFGLIILTFILTIIIMVLRCGGRINSSSNKAGYAICLTAVIIDVIAFIMVIIAEALILYRMWDLDDDTEYWRGRRYHYSKDYFSNSEWAAAIIPTSAAELCTIAHFYCLSFLLKLIKLKTDLSYLEYNETQTNNSSGNVLNSSGGYNVTPGTMINVYNTPPPPNNNQQVLSFIGYDKDGHPIYAGNNQYVDLNYPRNTQPIVNRNNNVNQINNIKNNKNNRINNINDNVRNNNVNNNIKNQQKNNQRNNNTTDDDNDDNIR